jgi:hypothetical protein
LGVAVLCGGAFGAGFLLRPWLLRGSAATAETPMAAGAFAGHPGPWGVLSYTPISIAAPDELLPVHAVETKPMVWFWEGSTPEDLSIFFVSLGLSAEQRAQLLQPAGVTVRKTGVKLRPPRETVLALEPAARQEIYKRLARFEANRDDFIYVPTAAVDDLWQRYGLSGETAALARQWSCSYGRYTVFFGLSCILGSLPVYDEKVRFLKAMSRQPTYLLHLQITPASDINALNRYWGKACWSTDVKAFLESVAAVRGGSWLDIMELLPPGPTSLLYTYPVPQNPLKGPVKIHDCHWTSFNFFRDPADERYANPDFVFQHLKDDFFPVPADPRYGDLVLLTKPDGSIIHSAIFLADGFVYSKNGDTQMHPWLICTIPDLLDQYSFQVPPDQKLNVVFFRNKYY